MRRLKEAKPFDGRNDDEKLWSRLKISYDVLDEDEQRMFLDFATIICEYKSVTHESMHKDMLARIWNSSIGVENLINMSLIKWNNEIEGCVMHDQLRDMD